MSLETIAKLAATTVASNGELLNKVYDDVVQPTAKNIGQATGTLTSTLNILLAPVSWLVYGFDLIDNTVKSKLHQKFSDTPLENLKDPDANIIIPAYEALRYSLDKENLKNMYVNLIASSMLKDKKDSVHPAYVEIIRQLSPADAKLLQNIFGQRRVQIPKIKVLSRLSVDDPSRGMLIYSSVLPSKVYEDGFTYDDCLCCLDNLERLKLIEITDFDISKDTFLMFAGNTYDDIDIDCFPFKAFPNSLEVVRGNIALTNFGSKFLSSVF